MSRTIIATAEVTGAYKVEQVEVYRQNGVVRFYAPSWRPMTAADAVMACRKVASHPGFIRFTQTQPETDSHGA